jgi:hypothetical protein
MPAVLFLYRRLMRPPLTLPLLVTACGFAGGEGELPQPDAPSCVPGFVNLCGQAPAGNFIIASTQINTDADVRCKTVTQKGGLDVCLLYFTDVEIQAGGVLFAHGYRPLVLAATGTMKIAGTIDVSSLRSRAMMPGAGSNPLAAGLCTFNAEPVQSNGGGGGGAGGTFAALGGAGGMGNLDGTDGSPADRAGGVPGDSFASLPVLRGGCNGQKGGAGNPVTGGGPSGIGGGGVYLTAAVLQIPVTGSVLAGGSGAFIATGFNEGAGGGGSGGAIVIESPMIAISGKLISTGGGGGKAANGNTDGAAGQDGVGSTAAPGGTGGGSGGNGGNGGTDGMGAPGMSANGGGGGGGGSAGFILLRGQSISLEGALIMPPATSPPSS